MQGIRVMWMAGSVALLGLVGCASAATGLKEPSAPTTAPTTAPPTAPQLCAQPAGLPPELVPTNGDMLGARFFTPKPGATVKLYRLFSACSAAATPCSKARKDGSYWTLSAPSGSKADYRAANLICEEWNDLDRLVVCELPAGRSVIVGSGAPATCPSGLAYPASTAPQVYAQRDWQGRLPFDMASCVEGPSPLTP